MEKIKLHYTVDDSDFSNMGFVSGDVQEKLGIAGGECTPDGKFSLEACRCIGACGLAPVLTVNEDVYGRLTVDDIDDILKKYAD